MSTAVFPNLPGASYPSPRSPVWDTVVQQAISGKETRIARQSSPRWKWDMSFSILRSGGGYNEFQQVVGFLNSRQGMFDTFLYQDPDDNSVSGQGIGTGNAVTTAFQLVRAFGGFVEPMLAPNSVSAVYIGATPQVSGLLSAPSAPTIGQTGGGSSGARTVYGRISYQTANGEGPISTQTSFSMLANNLMVVNSPGATTNGIGYNVYTSTTSNAETRQNSNYIPIGTNWTEPSTLMTNTGVAYNYLGGNPWTVSAWGSATPGIVTFAGAPANGAAVSADFTYYWPCRFNMDSADFSQFMNQFYELKKLSIISVKN